jgi:hypothetical protein
MNQISPPLEIPGAEDAAPSGYRRLKPYQLRLALILAVTLSAALVLTLTLTLVPPTQREPDLIRLLRGMVLIKGTIVLAAAALVWWRLGRPLAPDLAARYVAALCVSADAVAWLWGLHLIPLGSGVFYLGLLGLYLAGRRDPLLSEPNFSPSRRR